VRSSNEVTIPEPEQLGYFQIFKITPKNGCRWGSVAQCLYGVMGGGMGISKVGDKMNQGQKSECAAQRLSKEATISQPPKHIVIFQILKIPHARHHTTPHQFFRVLHSG
jgi:hypothetical protein